MALERAICGRCENEFWKRGQMRFCSACRRSDNVCTSCGTPDSEFYAPNYGRCKRCACEESRQGQSLRAERGQIKPSLDECSDCGEACTKRAARCRACSDKRRRKYVNLPELDREGLKPSRVRSAKRRALIAERTVGVVSREAVLERDKFRCHMCGVRCDPTVGHMDGLYPTLDHLVPLSCGGEHSMANLACACRACNTRKGFWGAGDQLALFG